MITCKFELSVEENCKFELVWETAKDDNGIIIKIEIIANLVWVFTKHFNGNY